MVVVKVDLSKAYGIVSCCYVRIIISQIGFDVPFISWIMGCLYSVSFSILINGSASCFFRPSRGIGRGFPLAPLLFVIIVEGLERAILDAKRLGQLSGITFGGDIILTHICLLMTS